jgi:hypothetical protein
MIRKGKIGRLPPALRERLNQRLSEGEPNTTLVPWLNSLPEVQSLLATDFHDQPISEPNLSRWKDSGFLDWQTEQTSLDAVSGLLESTTSLQDDAEGLTDRLALSLTAQITAALRRLNPSQIPPDQLNSWRKFCAQIVGLRRGDHFARYLRIQEQRLELERQQSQDGKEQQFLQWAAKPENQKKFCPRLLTTEEQRRKVHQILGIVEPETPSNPPPQQIQTPESEQNASSTQQPPEP